MRVIPTSSSSCVIAISTLIVCILSATLFCPPVMAQSSAVAPLITQPVDEAQLTTLKGNVYPLARPEYDLGTAPASLPMERMLLVLKRSPEQEFALRALLDDQQDQSSPNYHKWLAPEEYGRQFGPTDADLQVIVAWLESHGFQVAAATKGRTVIEFSGSASQVQEAFHTVIHKYLVNGKQHWANDRDPSIPAALAPAVAGIDSLHNFRKKAANEFRGNYSEKTKQLTSQTPSFPIGDYSVGCGGGVTCYAVVPYDFATIYDVLPLWTGSPAINGTGQTIAIVGRTNINPSDPTTFWNIFGLTVPANKLNIILNGLDPGINGDEGEADIDIQWSGAVAPQATIDFVTSQSTETTDGVDLSAVYIVDNNLAPVMSESYGQCELGLGTAGNQFYYSLWQQAAAQGISVFVSTGDNMSAGCDYPGGPAQYGLNVNGLASTPFNAAIGGTDFNQYNKWTTYWNSTNDPTTHASAKGYIPETTWNGSCTNPIALTVGLGTTAEQVCNNSQLNPFFLNSIGGSGGPSNCVVNTQGVLGSCTQAYPKPSWQKGTGVPADNVRDLPDISLFASNGIILNSFYVICQSDVTNNVCDLNDLAGYGGTSVSSPAFAGIMSLVNQKTGSPQGVPGFALYPLVSKQANAFHDVPSGTNIAPPCITGTPNCYTATSGDNFGVLSATNNTTFAYNTTAGYDLATGLGTVDAANLVNNWSKATFTPSTSALKLNGGTGLVSVTHGAAVPVSIAVGPTAATGNASLLVSNSAGTTIGKAIDGFALTSGATAAGATTSLLPGGSNYVIAHYGGDGTYGGSYSNTVQVMVAPENSTVAPTLLSPGGAIATTVSYDTQYWLRVDVENSKAQACAAAPFGEVACPTGTITVMDGSNNVFGNGTTFELNSEGYTETFQQLVALTGGVHNLSVQYSGDSSYNSNSTPLAITVNKVTPQMASPGITASNYTQPVTMSTWVNDPNAQFYDAPATGTVTFYSYTTGSPTVVPGTVSYNTVGTQLNAQLTATFSSPNIYNVYAVYSGDQNYATDTSGTSTFTLQYQTPTVQLTPATQTLPVGGGNATVTSLVDTTNKTQYPTGTVTFVNQNTGATVSGPTACTNTTDPSGNYACTVSGTFPVTTSENIVANYSGDAWYPSSSSPAAVINVPDFSISPGTSQVTVTQGQSQTVTINVTPLSGFTGTVGSFACSGLPTEATCDAGNPTTVTGSGSTTITITTAGVGQMRQMRRRAANDPPRTGWMATAMLSLLGLCLIGVPLRRRPRATLVTLMILTVALLPSCGGGGTPPPPPNPVPTISSLSPTQQAAGSASQTLTINGTGFMNSSTVTYATAAHTASFVSASQLTISLSASDLMNQGSFPVVVTNPAPGGGASSPSTFTVTTGTPTGTFTVTVSATSGSVTHNTTFTLVVQ